MREIFRQFAVTVTIIAALTCMTAGAFFVSARTRQMLTGISTAQVRLDTHTWRLRLDGAASQEVRP